jgi:hypothetical protein
LTYQTFKISTLKLVFCYKISLKFIYKISSNSSINTNTLVTFSFDIGFDLLGNEGIDSIIRFGPEDTSEKWTSAREPP